MPMELKEGYIEDCISRKLIKETPEERDAFKFFQVFLSRILVIQKHMPKQDHNGELKFALQIKKGILTRYSPLHGKKSHR
jgi:hypothetical protein